MDLMLILQVIVLLGAIFIGIRLGGIAIGYAGGLGVIVLGVLGLNVTTSKIAWDVILIIMAVIATISAMQLAGGLDYLVRIAEKILRSKPKYINYLAPTVTYFLTILAGTGHTAFSMIPVIVEVAKEQNIKPSAPLSIAVVASQIAITASPVSAAVVYLTGVLEPLGWSYPLLLSIWIPTTFIACMVTAFIITLISDLDLSKDNVYQERLKAGLVKASAGMNEAKLPKSAKTSVVIFLIGILVIVLYATAISKIGGVAVLIDKPTINRDSAIIGIMLIVATLIVISSKINPNKIADTSVFKSGMTACVCVLGVAWLGSTFVSGYEDAIKTLAKNWVSAIPAILAVVYFLAAMLLYSQAATAKAITPAVVVALGIGTFDADGTLTVLDASSSYMIVASFAAVSALFVLPTYPTLLGAVQMDDTGTTRIGKYIFNHSFFIPGVLAIVISVAFGFLAVSFF